MLVAGRNVAPELPGRQGRLLFAYLVQNRSRAVSRRELLDVLWGLDRPAAADGALSALLSKLRKALGTDSVSGRSEIRLRLPEPLRVDAEQAERAARDAEAALAGSDPEAAAAFARTALAVDVLAYLPDCSDHWVTERREQLAGTRIRALEALAGAALSLGGPELPAAEQAARAMLNSAPYREAAYRLLMEIHEASGNHAEALVVFDQLRSRLRDELDASPSPQTLAVFERLLKGEPARAPEPAIERSTWPAALSFAHGRHPFVGRGESLASLAEFWREAVGGRRRLVYVSGEDGVGKTRLAAEFARGAHEDGATVLYGRFDEDTVAPYKPLLEMVRGWSAGRPLDDVRVRLSARSRSALGVLLPELRAGDEDRSDGSTGGPGDRLQLFDAVAELLDVVARHSPLLLIFDDLQWADRPTQMLIRHLVVGGEPRRSLVVGIGSDIGAERQNALAELLDDLRRASMLDRLALRGLDRPETAELCRALGVFGQPEDLLTELQAQTEGNPYFVEEVVRHLDETAGRRVPEGIRDLAARRLAGLTEPTQSMLAVAAVLGREWEFPLLERVSRIDADELVGALEEAASAGLLRELDDGRWAFRHPMVRAALQDRHSALRRARLHLAAAETMIELHAADREPRLGAIAGHFERAVAAGAAERAVEFALAAADRADRLLAWEEAAQHYATALRVLAEDDRRRRCALLIARGTSLQRAGVEPAREVFSEAVLLARDLGDPALAAEAALGFAGPWSTLARVDDDVVDLLEEALADLGGEDSALRVRLLSRLSLELYYCGFPERRLELSAEAVEIARRMEDPGSLAVALDARHYALWRPDTVHERLEVAAELRRLASQTGAMELELEGAGWTVVDRLELGDVRTADIEMNAAAKLAESLRRPLYQWWTEVMKATLAQLRGDLGQAERLATDALEIGRRGLPEQALHYYAMGMFQTRREQARLDEAIEPVRHFVSMYPAIPAWRGVLALALADMGDLDSARREYEAVAAAGFENLPVDAQWLIATSVLGEVCGLLGDRDRAAHLYRMLEPYAARNVIVGRAASCNGSVSRVLGILASCLGDFVRADGHFSDALSQHNAMGARLWSARTRVAWASSLISRGDAGAAESARDLLADAVIAADALGLVAVGEAARDLLGGLTLQQAGS